MLLAEMLSLCRWQRRMGSRRHSHPQQRAPKDATVDGQEQCGSARILACAER